MTMSFTKDLNKYRPREEQQNTIDFIDKEFKEKPETKFFLLDLPVGVGKSHLAFMITDWYRKNVNKMSRVDVITNSKILQDQYAQTYESLCVLKGKENYECSQYNCTCAQGSELNMLNKSSCDECPYTAAKEFFMKGGISLTNFHLFMTYAVYFPAVFEKRNANVLIVDEAHDLEEVMSDFVSVRVTENFVKRVKFTEEKNILDRLRQIKTVEDYVGFLGYFLMELSDDIELKTEDVRQNHLPRESMLVAGKTGKYLGKVPKDVKNLKLVSDMNQLRMSIDYFLTDYKKTPENWVMESEWNEKTKKKEFSMQAIWCSEYLERYIFSKYDHIIMMSGTILEKHSFCSINGIDHTQAVYYSIDSPFEISKRKVIYMPLGKMSYTTKETTFKNYVTYVDKLLHKYNDKKGLIHTNSFELAGWLSRDIKNKRLLFHDSTNKDEILNEHYVRDEPTVIVSPSMSTGVSFDDDKARFQIIAKVPYPSLASQRNKIRKAQNPGWYSYRTVSGIMQMSGRAVRSSEDWADTIIIDGSFGDVLKYSGHLLPEWYKSSITKIKVPL